MIVADDPAGLGFDPGRLARIAPWMESYVERARFPGAAVLIARHGRPAWCHVTGRRDVENDRPWTQDTLVRAYSMSKPVTSVALMMLYEQGLFHLDEPVSAYLPEFSGLHALVANAVRPDQVEPVRSGPTIHQLLTHTSGLTYGFTGGVLSEAYNEAGIDFGPNSGGLADMVRRVAGMPLAFQPGSRWQYSVATDVLGRLVEVISGETFGDFLESRIFAPLGMADTGFEVPHEKRDRFAALYGPHRDGGLRLLDAAADSGYREGRVSTQSGGGGLVTTLDDYWRFAEMLRAGGSAPDGRLLGPRTLRFMATNHLPGDIASMGPDTFSETPFEGVGFGLGFWVMLDPARARLSASPGDHGWGGMASTVFWVDPVEDMVVLFLTQLAPSSTWPNRRELRALVHQALVD